MVRKKSGEATPSQPDRQGLTAQKPSVSVQAFLEEINRQPVADGFGLIFADARISGRQVIQVDNPHFMWPLPIEDMMRCRRLLIVSNEISQAVVKELGAQPILNMLGWYRFAMWDEANAKRD